MRRFLAVVLGLVAGGAAVAAGEWIGHQIYPPPPGIDPSDPQSIREIMGKLPLGAFLMLAAAWGMGSFVGGFFATWVARSTGFFPGAIVVAAFLFCSLAMLFMIPHPAWFAVLGIGAVIAAGWWGIAFGRVRPSIRTESAT